MSVDIETQRMALRTAVRELLDDFASDAQVRVAIEVHNGFDEKLWARLLEMGVLELAADEPRIHSDASYLDLVVVFEELGRTLAPVPALSTSAVIRALGGSGASQRDLGQWSADLLSGQRRAAIAVAVDEELQPTSTVRVADRDGSARLTGSLSAVVDADGADVILVLAVGQDGPGLYLVPTDGDGVTVSSTAPFDLTRPVADVSLNEATGLAIDAADEQLSTLLRVCWLLHAAEQVGVAQRALEEAVSYAKLRTQFGRTIGSFQAIKHSCTDMLLHVEGARCLVQAAAASMDGGDAAEAAVNVSLAAAYADETAVDNSQRCMQIHGGIGYTWEHVSHLVMRRAKANTQRFALASSHWQAVTSGLSERAGSGLV
jgi:alkylation response protein AidB-like acyl-CoA dehydrogenase